MPTPPIKSETMQVAVIEARKCHLASAIFELTQIIDEPRQGSTMSALGDHQPSILSPDEWMESARTGR
jgi:hypothetical protein